MTENRRTDVAILILTALLLPSCVLTGNVEKANINRGEQYLGDGVEAFSAGQYPVAESRFNGALRVFTRSSYWDGQIRAHIDLAELALQRYDVPSASAHINKAQALAVKHGVLAYERRIRLIRSSIALNQGDYVRAKLILVDLLGKSGPAAANHAPDAIYLAALVNRTALSEDQHDGELSVWVRTLERALAKAPKGKAFLQARLLRFQAELYRQQKEFGMAAGAFRKALSIYGSGSFNIETGATLSEWARLDMAQDRWVPAREKLRRSIQIMGKVGDRRALLKNVGLLAAVELKCGRRREARALSAVLRGLRTAPTLSGAGRQDLNGVLLDSK